MLLVFFKNEANSNDFYDPREQKESLVANNLLFIALAISELVSPSFELPLGQTINAHKKISKMFTTKTIIIILMFFLEIFLT